ncbi:MAG: hypothetical protein ACOVQX_00125 [Legionella sp.]
MSEQSLALQTLLCYLEEQPETTKLLHFRSQSSKEVLAKMLEYINVLAQQAYKL